MVNKWLKYSWAKKVGQLTTEEWTEADICYSSCSADPLLRSLQNLTSLSFGKITLRFFAKSQRQKKTVWFIPLIQKVCLWVPPFHININSEQSCKLNTLYIFCNLENQETETSWLKKTNWFLKPLLYVNFPLISLALPCSLENHQTAYAMCQQH